MYTHSGKYKGHLNILRSNLKLVDDFFSPVFYIGFAEIHCKPQNRVLEDFGVAEELFIGSLIYPNFLTLPPTFKPYY